MLYPPPMAQVWKGMAVVVPTFFRNDSLAATLRSIGAQERAPAEVIVVDNSGCEHALSTVNSFRSRESIAAVHLAMSENEGPAGAFAAAVRYLQGHQLEWMMCRGDDNPFPDSESIERLYQFAQRTKALRPAGIGTVGGWYDRVRGFSVRPTDEQMVGDLLDVDFIPGLGTPTYHLPTLTELGATFDRSLFFGSEEADLGLQVRSAGRRLLIDPSQGVDVRAAAGHAGLGARDRVTNRRTSVWRTYFAHRNRLRVSKRYGRWTATGNMVARSLGQAGLLLASRDVASARAVGEGIVTGLGNGAPRRRYVPERTAD